MDKGKETFLKCKKTGKVKLAGIGYIFYSHCNACNTSHSYEESSAFPQTYSDHFDVIIVNRPRMKGSMFSNWIDETIKSLEKKTS